MQDLGCFCQVQLNPSTTDTPVMAICAFSELLKVFLCFLYWEKQKSAVCNSGRIFPNPFKRLGSSTQLKSFDVEKNAERVALVDHHKPNKKSGLVGKISGRIVVCLAK